MLFAGKEWRKRQIRKISDKVFERVKNQSGRATLTFEDLYIAVLLVYNDINKRLPGPHFDPPSKDQIRSMMQVYKAGALYCMNRKRSLHEREEAMVVKEQVHGAMVAEKQAHGKARAQDLQHIEHKAVSLFTTQECDLNLDGQINHDEFVKFIQKLTTDTLVVVSQGLLVTLVVAPTVAMATKKATEGVPGVGKVVQKLPNSIYASLVTLAMVWFQTSREGIE
ncbi:hypothetical protein Golob_000817 [Gossypium lobatum]|uniref:EF-hand domain-containing protein n=1 Tax=Gossypium lobatum TaxID=34289 RepID=A0A7J8N956_9ROSI|nr:hypothetical protein [Gossypium lobatum]